MARPVSTIALAAFVCSLTACDTGDGKELRPVDPSVTTIATVPPATEPPTLPAGEQVGSPLDGVMTGEVPAAFQLFAPWGAGAAIDQRYTCDGDDVAPALSWTQPPPGTVQLAFSLVDESAAAGDGQPFVHWVIGGIEATEAALAEGVAPLGAAQGVNSFGVVGWSGPCPPVGEAHEYRLTMYALNQQVELADATPANELLDFIEAVSIGTTDLIGTYQR